MKKILVIGFVIMTFISACGSSSTITVLPSPTTVIFQNSPTATLTHAVPPTVVPTVEDKWKIFNSIATNDSPIQFTNPKGYWDILLTRTITFSNELQIKLTMTSKGSNGIILTSTETVPGDQWWQGNKRIELWYENEMINIFLRDGSQEEAIYSTSVSQGYGSAKGQIAIFLDRQGKKIRIERDGSVLAKIETPKVGNFPNGLFPDGQILEVKLASGGNSNAELTELAFLVPTAELNSTTSPVTPIDIQAPSIGGGFVAIGSWGRLILLNHAGSGKSLPETKTNSMFVIHFWPGSENERLIIGDETLLPRNLTWSPDGQHLSFTSLKQENGANYYPHGLYDYDMSSSPAQIREIEDVTTRVERLAWSPDGKYLAYVKTTSESSSQLFIISLPDYKGKQQITDYNVYDFAWSPDSKKLAIVAAPSSRTNRVRTGYVLNLADSSITPLTTQPYTYIWSPRWSPDGKMVAFVNGYSQGGSLYFVSDIVYGVSDSILIQEFKNEWVSWSPDGNHAIRSGLVSLFMCDSTLNIEKTIYDFVNKPRDFFILETKWSPNSNNVAYNLELLDGSEMYSLNSLDLDGFTKELDRRPSTGRYGEWTSRFVWSPDGNYILYVKYENDKYNIYTANIQSNDVNLFAYDLNNVVIEIAWQP